MALKKKDKDTCKKALELLEQAYDLLETTNLEDKEEGSDILCSLGAVISDLEGLT